MKNVNYASGQTPADYVCGTCGATNCKLWREFNTFGPTLCCAVCAAESQKKDISDIDDEGRFSDKHGFRCDQIGWRVPAIPDEEGVGYWGYSSVPQEGINWWRNLPTLPNTSSHGEAERQQLQRREGGA